MLGDSGAYASPLKIFLKFCALILVYRSDYVLKNFLKINIFLYRYTRAMGHLAPGEIFENMLQLKRFGLYFEEIIF